MKRRVFAAVAVAVAVAPGSASAARVEVASPSGFATVTYTARAGEVNAPRLVGTVSGFDLRMPLFEYAAPLSIGDGCTPGRPVLCGAPDQSFPVDVSLGDEDDVAFINIFTNDTTLDAG